MAKILYNRKTNVKKRVTDAILAAALIEQKTKKATHKSCL